MRLNKDGTGLTALGAASFQQLSEIKVYQYQNDTSGAATASPLALSPRQTFLRLIGIKDSTNGRLEIYANGQWGTICVDQWTDSEAKVSCNMMGFNRSLARSTSFYPTELEMAMNSFDKVQCTGNEDHIVYCNVTANNWDVHDCSKLGVAGVKCENDFQPGVLDPVLDNFLLFNDVFEGQLVRMDTETFSYTTVSLQYSNFTPIAIAFDPLAQKVYFSEVKGNNSLIRQTDLRGQIINTLGSTPVGSVINGMTVDTRQDIIFYTDSGNRRIVSIKPDGSNYLVVSSDVDQPKGLAIDKNAGVVYWTDCGSRPRIESASYDGSNRKTIIGDDLDFPYGIALDITAGKLYFCDAGTKTIEVVNLDGTNRTVLYKDFRSACYGLALTSKYIFFSDWTKMNVVRLNRDGSSQTPAGPDSFTQIFEVYAFDSTFQQ